jgi:glycosyltransferase involved in cell wall biosynthesis
MRILMLTQWFDPEPAFKGLQFAKALKARGHEVEVLTGFPNYPGGKLYPGYKVKPWQREEMDGIRVNRVALYPSHDKNALHRVANYASFALAAAMLGPLLVKKPDVIYCYHPPASIGVVAVVLKTVFRAPLVYDIQDMWPDTLAATGMLNNPAILAAVGAYCKALYRFCDHLVVLSPGFKKLLVERGVPKSKVTMIYNWTHETEHPDETDQDLAKKLGMVGKFNVLFAGTMGLAQGLDAVLDAAKLVAKHRPEVQFVFVGGGVDLERLEKRVKDEAISNVLFLPLQPPSAMGPLFAAADVLLVHLKDDPLFRITIPSKTQAYLLAGKPILMAVAGDSADLVRDAGAGIACKPGDPAALADAVMRLASMDTRQLAVMGAAGKRFYQERMSLAVGVASFERVFALAGQ